MVSALSFLCFARLSKSANVTSLSGGGVAGVALLDGPEDWSESNLAGTAVKGNWSRSKEE